MDNRKNLPMRSRTTREIAVCVPTEQVARKSAANDAVGKGIRMEAAFATAAPSSPTFIMMLQPVCSMRSRFSTLSVAPLAEDRRQEIRLGKRPVCQAAYFVNGHLVNSQIIQSKSSRPPIGTPIETIGEREWKTRLQQLPYTGPQRIRAPNPALLLPYVLGEWRPPLYVGSMWMSELLGKKTDKVGSPLLEYMWL